MNEEFSKKIEGVLITIMSDGLNRSMGALEEVGAIDRTEMMKQYKGNGSKYYDLVTEHLELTAKYGKEAIIELVREEYKEELK